MEGFVQFMNEQNTKNTNYEIEQFFLEEKSGTIQLREKKKVGQPKFRFVFTNLATEVTEEYDYNLTPTVSKVEGGYQLEVSFEFNDIPNPNGYWELVEENKGGFIGFAASVKNSDMFSLDAVACDLEYQAFYIPNIDENGKFTIRRCGERNSFVKREAIEIKELIQKNEICTLKVDTTAYQEATEVRIVIWSKKGKLLYRRPISLEEFKKGIVSFNLQEFGDEYLEFTRKHFTIYAEMNVNSEYVLAGFKAFFIKQKDKKSKYELYQKPYENGTFEEETKVVVPYYAKTANGYQLNIAVLRKYYMYNEQFYEKIRKVKQKGSVFSFEVVCKDRGFTYKEIFLSLRSKIEEKRYNFDMKQSKNLFGQIIIKAQIDLANIELAQFYWDIGMVIEKDGEEFDMKMKNKGKLFRRSFYFRDITYDYGDGYIVYPYVTMPNTLALYYREKGEYDNKAFHRREYLALFLYYLLKPYWDHKKIWLVYEKFCVMAQDNGYFFFKYCMEQLSEKEKKHIYYIMDTNSPDYEKVKEYGKQVIPFMSLKHCIYLKASKLLITTDTRQHSYAWRSKNSLLKARFHQKKIVFLQHGVIALKQVHEVYRKKGPNRMNLFITSSEFEKKIIMDNFGYNSKEVAVTGLARWDVLKDKSKKEDKKILLMPTWRNWLDEVDDETFKESDYFKNYMSLLNNEVLCEKLKEKGVSLIFYIHPKFKDYIGNFEIKNTEVTLIPFGQEPLNELMMESSMLITDYSSVCWDVFYQEKPVVFYQFDLDMYLETQGSYIDMETELFGDRASTIDELFALIDYYVDNDFAEKEQYKQMRDSLYAYRDDHNCERIMEEIKQRGW